MEFSKMIKPLEALATECALENLHGGWLRFTVAVLKGLHKHPQNIVVEYADGWKSHHFAVYGFIGTQINLMISFDKMEMFLDFVRAAQYWNANWVLHESMDFVPITPSASDTKATNGKSQRVRIDSEIGTFSALGPCKSRCFICDEQLTEPNQHLKAVKCDRFNLGVPLWAHL